jgi:glycosyltransferase involved in cell wall biosynthesis
LPEAHVVMLTPHGDPLGRIGEPDIGGQCVYIRELARHLSNQGMRVTAFTRDRSDGKQPVESFAPRATVVRIPCGPSGFVPKEEILPHLDEFVERVRAQLSGDEILHSHYWDGGYVASRLHTSRPWFHSTHSLGRIKMQSLPDDAKYGYRDRIRIEEDVFRTCDRVFALTAIERAQIIDLYGVAEDRVCVIPPGVDTKTFLPRGEPSEHRRELGLPDAPTVLTLGRLDERKGLDLFVKAVEVLIHRSDIPLVSFVMSAGDKGDDGSEQTKIEYLVSRLGPDAPFTWLPVLDEPDIPRFYNASDVFVLPSRYEPFGIVMLEAMASGVPVVATDNGGPVEVIEHGVDGLLGDPADPHAFSSLIASLITDPRRREAFGLRAHEKAVANYSWDAIARRFQESYNLKRQEVPDAR